MANQGQPCWHSRRFEHLFKQNGVIFTIAILVAGDVRRLVGNAGATAEFNRLVGKIGLYVAGNCGDSRIVFESGNQAPSLISYAVFCLKKKTASFLAPAKTISLPWPLKTLPAFFRRLASLCSVCQRYPMY